MIISKIKSLYLLVNKKAIDNCLKCFSNVRWNYYFPLLLCLRGTKVSKNRIRRMYYVLEGISGINSIRLSSTDTITLASESFFYKFPLTEESENRIHIEYEGWKAAREIIDILIIPDVELVSDCLEYLRMPLLEPVPEANRVQSYKYIVDSLLSKKYISNTEISDDIRRGSEIIKRLIDSRQASAFVESFERDWLGLRAFRSATHGDLHPGNILQYNKMIVLIDLDRFDKNGFSGFDLIHLYLRIMKTDKKGWMYRLREIKLEDIAEAFNTDIFDIYSIDAWNIFKTAYWFDRIGKEQNFGNTFNPAMRDQTLAMYFYVKDQWVKSV